MTISQLQNFGIAMNKWDTLEGVCKSMLFSNEGYISPSQKTSQFYIDSSNGLIFVRHTRGDLLEDQSNPLNQVLINVKTKSGEIKPYFTTLCKGGIVDKSIGTYHECFDIAEITSVR